MSFVQSTGRWLRSLGFDLQKSSVALQNIPRYMLEARQFRRMNTNPMPWGAPYPVLSDYQASAGSASGHYFHMDLWAARKIYHANPATHLDIGSRVDGFIAHLLTFREVTVIDIRPLESNVCGLKFFKDDATLLSKIESGSVNSLSCLHAAEHFGLGRYGDPLDPIAHLKLFKSIQRVLMPGGKLYFAVPIGRERIEFNAHRIFSASSIISQFNELDLVSFSAVDDDGFFFNDAIPEAYCDAKMSCGLFEFEKRK